jgi:RNA polymerase sigma-70 factor (ECF subfamily)
LAEVPSLQLASDADVAARVAAGDRDAEAEMFRRLAPRIRLYGLRHLRDRAAADDLVQDVMLMACDSLRKGKVRDPQALASFVLGMCRKVLANLRRGERRRRELLERHGRELVPAFSEPEPLLDLDRLARCLTALSERERTVVVSSFYVERSADEIGTELGLTPGNVRVVRHRALASLRSCMEGGA